MVPSCAGQAALSGAASSGEATRQEDCEMRNWAATFGLVGGALSTAFWAWVPFSHSNNIYTQPGLEPLYVAFIIMSIGGVLGALIAGVSDRWSPLLMGIAVISADRKSTRLNSSHTVISYAVFC